MTIEFLYPSGDDNGWPTNDWTDIEESIASADGVALETGVDDDIVLIDLDNTALTDAHTINSVTVKILAKDTSPGTKNSLVVDLFIGGAGQGPVTSANLTASYGTVTLVDATNWDIDWTAAQLNGMQLQIRANQTGKGEEATWHIDAIDVEVDYTAPAAGSPIPVTVSRPRFKLAPVLAAVILTPQIVDVPEPAQVVVRSPVPHVESAPPPVINRPAIADVIIPDDVPIPSLFARPTLLRRLSVIPPVVNKPQVVNNDPPTEGQPLFATRIREKPPKINPVILEPQVVNNDPPPDGKPLYAHAPFVTPAVTRSVIYVTQGVPVVPDGLLITPTVVGSRPTKPTVTRPIINIPIPDEPSTTQGRSTQTVIESLGSVDPMGRSTITVGEVLGSVDPMGRSTITIVEVLMQPKPPFDR